MSVGSRTPQIGWAERTTGTLDYTGDVRLEGTLFARVLRSPHPHATIRSIDVAAARRVPGVRAVLTGADLPGVTYRHYGDTHADRYPLARGRVRFVGEEVAAVAADSAEAADEALTRIRVRYRRRTPVAGVDAALRRGAPRVHHRPSGTNVAAELERDYGDLAAATRRTTLTVDGIYRFGRQAHALMEPSSTLASYDAASGTLHVWTPTQAPWFVRTEIARTLQLADDQVRVREVGVGGGFGARSKICDHETIAAALSMSTGRPVRLALTRAEEFTTTKTRHEMTIELETGLDDQGRITYRCAELLVDNGAYNHTGPAVMAAAMDALGSLYRAEAVHCRGRLVDTTTVPGGQFRGYGFPQITFAVERQMDELAELAGVDPLQLRLRNLLTEGEVTLAGWRIGSTRVADCVQRAATEIGWHDKRHAAGSGRGVGLAVGIHKSGVVAYPGADRSESRVTVSPSGRIGVSFGGADAGTGQSTLLAQVVAEELAVSPNEVEVEMMDSARTPHDHGAWSSRGTHVAGHATRDAARQVADELRRVAADKLACPPSEVDLIDGAARHGHDHIVYGDLAAASDLGPTEGIEVLGAHQSHEDRPDLQHGYGNISPSYPFAAHAAEVEVDQRTGAVTVVDYVAVHDCGRAINPTAVEGQITGGVAMGLGAALREEIVIEGGRIANDSYTDYALPRAADVPTIRPIVLDGFDAAGPYGAKSVGEVALNPVAAAVANAVANALDAPADVLPLTPDRLVDATAHHHGGDSGRPPLWRRPSRWWVAVIRLLYPRGLHAVLHRVGTQWAHRPGRTTVPSRLVTVSSVEEAVAAVADPRSLVVGGASDVLAGTGTRHHDVETLVGLTRVEELGGVTELGDGSLRLGATATLEDLLTSDLLPVGSVVRAATERIATPQLRAVATVGGNLAQEKRCWYFRSGFDCYKRSGPSCPCYAVTGDHRHYHAAANAHRCQAITPSDLATALTALDATVDLIGPGGRRSVPAHALYIGPGELCLAADEVIEAVRIERASAHDWRQGFEKLALYEGGFAMVAASVALEVDDRGSIRTCRAVLGGVAPTPWRLARVEAACVGTSIDRLPTARVASAWEIDAHPLPGNGWKVPAATALVERALGRAATTSSDVPDGHPPR